MRQLIQRTRQPPGPHPASARRRAGGLLVAGLALLTAASCTTSADLPSAARRDATAVASEALTPVAQVPIAITATARSADGLISLAVGADTASIRATTDADGICSPAAPAVAVLTATLGGERADDIVEVRAILVDADRIGHRDASALSEFALDDDGVWRAVVGPAPAGDVGHDRFASVRIEARTKAVTLIALSMDLGLSAPVGCGTDVADERDVQALGPIEVATDPRDAIVARGDRCTAPARLGIEIDTPDDFRAVFATFAAVDGAARRAFVGYGEHFRLVLRPEELDRAQLDDASADGGAEPRSLPISIEAVDALGRSVSAVVDATVYDTCPADTGTGTDRAPTTTGDPARIELTPVSGEIWATAADGCDTEPTMLDIEISDVADDVTSVSVTARTDDRRTRTSALTRSGSTWRGAVGPFADRAVRADRSTLTIEATLSRRSGGASRTTATGAVLRPPRCPETAPSTVPGDGTTTTSVASAPAPASPGTVATPSGVPPTTSPSGAAGTTATTGPPTPPPGGSPTPTAAPAPPVPGTNAATTTVAVVTSPSTTATTAAPGVTTTSTTVTTTTAPGPIATAAPPTTAAPVPISVSARVTPSVVRATCGTAPGAAVTVSASTSGPVAEVTALVTRADGASASTPLEGNGSSWTGSVGPFEAPASIPARSTLTVEVVARASDGRTASSATTATLSRPPSCDA